MCVPCGLHKSTRQSYSGTSYFSYRDMENFCSLEKAMEKYPDNDEALEKIKTFFDENRHHTRRWIGDALYRKDHYLARIMVVPENLKIVREYYNEKCN